MFVLLDVKRKEWIASSFRLSSAFIPPFPSPTSLCVPWDGGGQGLFLIRFPVHSYCHKPCHILLLSLTLIKYYVPNPVGPCLLDYIISFCQKAKEGGTIVTHPNFYV